MSWNVWNRPSGSFMVDMGISSNIIKSPSPKCYMTFWDMTIYNDTLNWFNSIEHCNGCASQQRTLTPPDTWSVPFGTCICSNVETILSWTCLRTFWVSNIPQYFYFPLLSAKNWETEYRLTIIYQLDTMLLYATDFKLPFNIRKRDGFIICLIIFPYCHELHK